jgi:hypothetical protein
MEDEMNFITGARNRTQRATGGCRCGGKNHGYGLLFSVYLLLEAIQL